MLTHEENVELFFHRDINGDVIAIDCASGVCDKCGWLYRHSFVGECVRDNCDGKIVVPYRLNKN